MSSTQYTLKDIIQERPALFSREIISIPQEKFDQIKSIIESCETAIHHPTFQKLILSHAPIIAHKSHGPRGVFMGYDFHLSDQGPQLIEINTNAGGGLINLELARHLIGNNECYELIEKSFIQMFQDEWRSQRAREDLKNLVIVDDNPTEQFLYPEFKLFVRLFSKYGINAYIADPKELSFSDGVLKLRDIKVDFVYNRLTDFYLTHDNHMALKSAYEKGIVVVTPNPHHHALYANKLNFIKLTDPETLKEAGLAQDIIETLIKSIPKTNLVCNDCADELWEKRKHLFFKPAAGYGSKATYRGDKVTHRVWEEMLRGEYVAQEFAPPGEQIVKIDEQEAVLKVDLRAYVYHGKIQLMAARLYSGQTTNFRTPGGGFAPVIVKTS